MMRARFTILVVWSLVSSLVSVPGQTPQSKTSSRTVTGSIETKLIATPQAARKAIQQGILGRIASNAGNSLRTYPSSAQIRKIGNSRIRQILERGRSLLEAGKTANRWNATRLSGFASQLDQYLKDAEAVANSTKLKNEHPREENCAALRLICSQRCLDEGGIDPYCEWDCAMKYMNCLVGGLSNTSSTLIS